MIYCFIVVSLYCCIVVLLKIIFIFNILIFIVLLLKIVFIFNILFFITVVTLLQAHIEGWFFECLGPSVPVYTKLVVMNRATSSITSDLDNNIVLGKSNILRGHTSIVRTMCVIDNLIISCGSKDGKIHIWDITKPNSANKECVQILVGHTGWINTICVKDNLIISGSDDKTIRIWDRDDTSTNISTNKYDYKCVQVLTGHTYCVNTICVKDNLIISGSDDKTIRIWGRYDTSSNTSTYKYDYKCVQILTGHTSQVLTICVKDNLIISGSGDNTIRIWDRDDTSSNTSTNKYDYKCAQILTEHTGWINTICVKDNLIISGSDDKTIRIWDMTNTNSDTSTNKYDYKCTQILEGHTGYVISLCVKDNLIISGSNGGTIRMWDMTNTSSNKYNYKCMQVVTGHSSWVMSICVKDNLIISGSTDKTIRMTPINLSPDESHIFKILINNYHLVSYLQKEIVDYFRGE